ncbi:MAG: ribose-5-phosphate isomerase RpiA [Chloroflexota bacterium]
MNDAEKALVGQAAADEVQPGMVLGLGTGTTTYFFLRALGERIRGGLSVSGIPTSNRTGDLAKHFGIALTTFDERQSLDLAVDGADEVDPELRLIKGQGGALLREKLIARAARRRIYIVDSGKLSPSLGTHSRLPVEVIPFAWRLAELGLRALGCEPELRPREPGQRNGHPYCTDNGNYILDCSVQPADPRQLEDAINRVPGVVENGLFIGLTDELIVGRAGQIERLLPPTH